ncbi:hypothetical protein JYB88_16185 [Shewanella cyperi]|uniref:Uncharacterized protein n=1 Tax=Shewanella cyperi TaxID=2814292 RepID=A0A974XM01_9GAMM|nr:hypothetical protein [Shewanella cyperi]QSX29708.1 hypothetical protein JYB88_16185 [Shewanella cyperi]
MDVDFKHRIAPLLALALILLPGCNSTPRQVKPAVQSQQPQIVRVRDIGSQLPTATAKLSKLTSDGLIYPGELLAIEGNIPADAQIQIDGQVVTKLQQLDKAVLIRVPAELAAGQAHRLSVSNAQGMAQWEFFSRHYIIATDTDANRLQFMRTDPKAKGLIEMDSAYDMTLDLKRAMFTQVSPSHAYLYAFGIDGRERAANDTGKQYHVLLQIIDLTAPGQPALLTEIPLELQSQPTAVARNGQQMILLGAKDLAILDVSDELAPKVISRMSLPGDRGNEMYLDVLFLQDGRRAAVLEAINNQVLLLDTENPQQPRELSRLQLFKDAKVPLLVDLERDPRDPNRFWALAGANLRVVSTKAKDLYHSLFGDDDTVASEAIPEMLQLLSINNDRLEPGQSITLPDNFVPFYAAAGEDNRLYVSGINGELLDFHDLSLDSTLIKQLFGGLLGTVQFGRILAVDTATAQVSNHAKGLGLYYHLTYNDDLGPVFALYKLSGKIFAPFVKVKWGVGVNSRGTFAIREGSATSIFPPYSVGHVSIQ